MSLMYDLFRCTCHGIKVIHYKCSMYGLFAYIRGWTTTTFNGTCMQIFPTCKQYVVCRMVIQHSNSTPHFNIYIYNIYIIYIIYIYNPKLTIPNGHLNATFPFASSGGGSCCCKIHWSSCCEKRAIMGLQQDKRTAAHFSITKVWTFYECFGRIQCIENCSHLGLSSIQLVITVDLQRGQSIP